MTRDEEPTAMTPARAREVVGHLRTMSPRQQLDYLLERGDLEELLPRLPVQDVYALVRHLGLADAMDLLEKSPAPVLQGMADLAVWNHDRLDPRSLASFYAALFHADPDGATDKILDMDIEMSTLFLKLHIHVVDISNDDMPDGPGELMMITPDRKLAVSFVDPPGLPENEEDPLGLGERGRELARHAARQLLEGIIRKDPALVSRLLDSARWELPSQLEEDALRWRTGRLEDLGIPPREQALAVLAYLDPDAPHLSAPPAVEGPHDEEDGVDMAMALYTQLDTRPREPFLGAALKGLSEPRRTAVARELAYLCNRVAVARDAALGDVDSMRLAVMETRTMLDLGLAYRTRGHVEGAAEVASQTALTDLYRVGHSLTLKLQRQAHRMMQPAWGEPRVVARLLDPPGSLALAALLAKTPRFYAGLVKPASVERRAFATLEDVTVATRALAEVTFRLTVAFDVMGFAASMLTSAALEGTNLADRSEITVEILLTTALVRAAGGKPLDSSPLTAAELQQARSLVQNPNAVAAAGAALGVLVSAKAPLPGARSPEDAQARAAALASTLLARLAEECAGVPSTDPLDGRYITRVLVALPG